MCSRPSVLISILRVKGKGTETGKIREWREERGGREGKKGKSQKPFQAIYSKIIVVF